MEEIIFLILILLSLLLIFSLYILLNKRGLYFALVLTNLLTLIFSFKIAFVFKMNINISLIGIISTYTIIYIIINKYGYKDSKNILLLSLYTNVITSILIAIMNYYIPAITETISINMQGTFEYNYKILIFYPIIIFISEYLSIKLYKFLSSLQNKNSINIVLTYIIIGLLYTIIFYILSYIKILEISDSIFIGVSTYILGIPITIIHLILINFVTNRKVIQ